MKIRRYMGKDNQEAILKVKMDLGSEAVILNTRKVRQKGLLNVFSKPLVEVLAAVDESYGTKVAKESYKNYEKNYEKNSGDFKIEARDNLKMDKKDDKIHVLENKVTSMETMLQKIYEQVHLSFERQDNTRNPNNTGSLEKALELFQGKLAKSEVDEAYIKQLADAVRQKAKEGNGTYDAASILYNLIGVALGKPETLKLRQDGKPTVVMFIGPTGVGKTTTLAKIAANYSLNHKKSVGLITADTYRIAAVEQLKTYAEILDMPVEVIYSAGEIQDAMSVYQDKDIILIDTAGRSYKNKSQIEELRGLIEATDADEIFLVLSTTTGMGNCREILGSYSFLKDYKIIFTKLDESSNVGVILNTRNWTQKSLSYITTGQSVPDDIEVVNVDKIIKNLLGSIL